MVDICKYIFGKLPCCFVVSTQVSFDVAVPTIFCDCIKFIWFVFVKKIGFVGKTKMFKCVADAVIGIVHIFVCVQTNVIKLNSKRWYKFKLEKQRLACWWGHKQHVFGVQN